MSKRECFSRINVNKSGPGAQFEASPLPISRLGKVACPRCLAQEITQYSGSASPDLKVGKGGLPPLSRPRDHSILWKRPSRSQRWEGCLDHLFDPQSPTIICKR